MNRIALFIRLTHHHGGGGMESHSRVLVEGLAKRGWTVDVITTGRPDGVAMLTEEGVRYHFCQSTPPAIYSPAWLKAAGELFEKLHKERPFRVAVSQGMALVHNARRVAHAGVPIVVIDHGTWMSARIQRFKMVPSPERPRILFKWFPRIVREWWKARILYYLSSRIIAVSPRIHDSIIRNYFVRKGKVVSINNGVDLSFFRPPTEMERAKARQELNLGETFTIVSVGALVPGKGILEAMDAIAILVRDFPHCIYLIVGDGYFRQELIEKAQRSGMGKIARFLGRQDTDEVRRSLWAADSFLMASIGVEGAPLSLIEAMACGLPAVATNVGGNANIVINGVTGELVPPGEVKAMADALGKVLKNSKPDMRRAARSLACDSFGLVAMIDQYERVIESVVGC